MADYSRFDANEIKRWTSDVFEKLGVPPKDAEMTTGALIHADLMGIDSHGLNRVTVQSYAGGLKAGTIWQNTYNQFDPTSPFGGYKESGFGREGGAAGLRPYVRIR